MLFQNDAKYSRFLHFQKGFIRRCRMGFILLLDNLRQNAQCNFRRGHSSDGQTDRGENASDLFLGKSGIF